MDITRKLKPHKFTSLAARDEVLNHLRKMKQGTHPCTHAQAEKIMAVWDDLHLLCEGNTFTFADDFNSITKE